jgi:hypothetical protein
VLPDSEHSLEKKSQRSPPKTKVAIWPSTTGPSTLLPFPTRPPKMSFVTILLQGGRSGRLRPPLVNREDSLTDHPTGGLGYLTRPVHSHSTSKTARNSPVHFSRSRGAGPDEAAPVITLPSTSDASEPPFISSAERLFQSSKSVRESEPSRTPSCIETEDG